jgi:hypothetical protein
LELGTPAVAASGAVFGVGTTLVTDLVRSRREQDRYGNDTKRVVYTRFLASLAQTHSRMLRAGFREQPDDARRDGVHEAFHNDRITCTEPHCRSTKSSASSRNSSPSSLFARIRRSTKR